MEARVSFQSQAYLLEGILHRGSVEEGIVIAHPHPLYGGDMYNTVVESIAEIYQSKGYTTLRFNFRGVGNSQGRYAKGVGERNDTKAAVDYLKELGIKTPDLGGYSFGAWVNAFAAQQDQTIRSTIMVSPPVAVIDFSSIGSIPSLKLVVSGSRDEFAPGDQIKEMLPGLNASAHLEIIPGADHFYGGHLEALKSIISAYG
ncbi:MAG: alpha/beta hydrolase [Deltaproteobacteria bacterium]|nr:alpha/beta hydrolase [Deltaproteobacteria bacterium]